MLTENLEAIIEPPRKDTEDFHNIIIFDIKVNCETLKYK